MTGLITLIGLIALFAGIFAFIGSFLVKREASIENEGTRYEKQVPPSPAFLINLATKKLGALLLIGGMGMMLLSNSIYYAERGVYYEIIYPNGTKAAEFEEGYHLVVPFTRVNSWTANIDVKAGSVDQMSDDVEGKMPAISVTFVDQVGAQISSAYRFTLPRDEQAFLDLCVKYRSISNLTDNTLIPTIAEQAKLTSKMFSAQDYISGSSQAFRQTFEEQLKGGTYVVSKRTNRDTTYLAIPITKLTPRTIKDISITYSVAKKRDKNNKAIRIQNEISASGIIVSQVIVNEVEVDASYKKRLVSQKAESAKRQLEQQKIETAKIAQQRIKAEGERDKAKEAASQEIAQVKKLIAIETKLKEEETNLKLAKIQLETEKTNAKKKMVSAKATAFQNRQLVAAGLTPQEKADFALKEKIGIANATAKMATPEVVIITNGAGSGNNSSNLTNALIQAEMAKKLINKTK